MFANRKLNSTRKSKRNCITDYFRENSVSFNTYPAGMDIILNDVAGQIRSRIRKYVFLSWECGENK